MSKRNISKFIFIYIINLQKTYSLYLVRNFSNLLLNNYKMLRFLSESPKNTKKPTKRVRTNLHSKSINFCTFLGISQNGRSAIEETYRILDITNVPFAIGFKQINGKTFGQFEQIIRCTIHFLPSATGSSFEVEQDA